MIVQQPRQQIRWKAPERGWVKVIWDAAVIEKSQKMGIGVVIRDFQGEVMDCLSSLKPFHSHSIVVEYEALWRAMYFCMELGFERAQFEGDTELLINAITNEAECVAWFGHLVEEAKQIFKNRSHWTIPFVHWEGNGAAHLLAKSSLNLYAENVWIEDTPNLFSNIVFEKLSNQWK